MGITWIALASKIGYVAIVGATSILANTLIAYHHNFKSNKKTKHGGERYESKSQNERIDRIRKLHQAE